MTKSTCAEYFGGDRQRAKFEARSDGMCGQRAEFIVSIGDDPWTPRCARCAGFYNAEYVRPLTDDIDASIAKMQEAGE